MDVVLILGESSSRRLWQLYGAPGTTTPRLQAMASQLIVMKDVVSVHSHTVPSVREMMYRDRVGPDVGAADGPAKVSLIDVLKQAGVRTEWISAQAPYGKWAAPVSRLASASARAVFINRDGDGSIAATAGLAPDRTATAEVVATLGRDTGGSSRLIVEHLFASHWPYCSHQPEHDARLSVPLGAAWFGDAPDNSKQLACYMGATRFVDEQIATIAAAVQRQRRPTVLIFVPDHGEDPEGGTGHSSSAHAAPHVEIPMVVAFNDAARLLLPHKADALAANASQPFLNAWIFELLLDLFGIETDDIHSQITSPTSTGYRPKPRVLFPRDRPLQYDSTTESDRKDALERTRLNLKELTDTGSWTAPLYAHRVNTIGKLLDAKQSFPGIEMDVVYDAHADELFVYHPPAANTGLRLQDQLAALTDKPRIKLWLDFKNPTLANAEASLARLEDIDRNWHIKDRSVLEIPAEAAGAGLLRYANSGWAVAYYVPYAFADCGRGGTRDATECRADALGILQRARSIGARYLSFDESVTSAMLMHLAADKGNLGFLSWRPRIDSSSSGLADQLSRVPPLSGLIIELPSAYSR